MKPSVSVFALTLVASVASATEIALPKILKLPPLEYMVDANDEFNNSGTAGGCGIGYEDEARKATGSFVIFSRAILGGPKAVVIKGVAEPILSATLIDGTWGNHALVYLESGRSFAIPFLKASTAAEYVAKVNAGMSIDATEFQKTHEQVAGSFSRRDEDGDCRYEYQRITLDFGLFQSAPPLVSCINLNEMHIMNEANTLLARAVAKSCQSPEKAKPKPRPSTPSKGPSSLDMNDPYNPLSPFYFANPYSPVNPLNPIYQSPTGLTGTPGLPGSKP